MSYSPSHIHTISLTQDVDDLPSSQSFSGPPLHRYLRGQTTQVGHTAGVGVVVESPSCLSDETHACLTGADQGIGSHLYSKEFLTCRGKKSTHWDVKLHLQVKSHDLNNKCVCSCPIGIHMYTA